MTVIVVGEPGAAEELARATSVASSPVRTWTAARPDRAPDPSSSAPLAHALVAFEPEIEAVRPDAVVLADDSDSALAAALVALKLLIAVEAAPAASEAASVNGRLIAQLAAAYTLAP